MNSLVARVFVNRKKINDTRRTNTQLMENGSTNHLLPHRRNQSQSHLKLFCFL